MSESLFSSIRVAALPNIYLFRFFRFNVLLLI